MMFILVLIIALFGVFTTDSSSSVPRYSLQEELPFVIHICSFNNKPWVTKNLDSVFMQKYDNFRVVYVDDQSEDGTADEVRAYLDEHDLWDRVTLVENKVRHRKMKNMYSTIRLCDDQEIIVQLDGDDWFCDDQLLSHLNYVYQTQDVWLTYGSYEDYPANRRGYCTSTPKDWIEKKLYRKREWLYMHPRSFYAWLFKAIKVGDHLAEGVKGYEGEFFPSADDQASYWPMLEMAGKRFAYLPEISYICNRGNPLCGRVFESPLQSACGGDARKRSVYTTLTHPLLETQSKYANSSADVMVISNNNPKGAQEVLHSIEQHLVDSKKISVFYVADKIDAVLYDELKGEFPAVQFIQCWDADMFYQLTQYLKQSEEEHVLLVGDGIKLTYDIHMATHIQHLETTSAYGFYFAFEPKQAPFFNGNSWQLNVPVVHLYDTIYAWKFSCGQFALFNNIDCTLFRKKDALDRFYRLMHQKEQDFFCNYTVLWQTDLDIDQHAIGLMLEESPCSGALTQITQVIPMPSCIHVEKKSKIKKGKSIIKDKPFQLKGILKVKKQPTKERLSQQKGIVKVKKQCRKERLSQQKEILKLKKQFRIEKLNLFKQMISDRKR